MKITIYLYLNNKLKNMANFGGDKLIAKAVISKPKLKRVSKEIFVSVGENIPVRIILFGGVDLTLNGDTGNAAVIATYVKTYALSKNITLKEEEIKSYNSPWLYPINGSSTKKGVYTYEDMMKDQIYDPVFLEMNRKKYDRDKGLCVVYGYSLGGQYALGFVKYLKEKKINVDVLYTIDGAKGPGSGAKDLGIYSPDNFKIKTIVPSNVKLNINIYQTKKSKIGSRGFPNTSESNNTIIKNVDVSSYSNIKGVPISHDNIDEYTGLFVVQSIINTLVGKNQIANMSSLEIMDIINRYDKKSDGLFY